MNALLIDELIGTVPAWIAVIRGTEFSLASDGPQSLFVVDAARFPAGNNNGGDGIAQHVRDGPDQ
jgi:hypothetical protein